MTEEWKPIPGFEGYDVSDQGRVRSWRKRRSRGRGGALWTLDRTTPYAMKLRHNRYGYATVKLFLPSGGYKMCVVHRLVALTFHGPAPKDKPLAIHYNGIRDDNRPENIRWGSPGDNNSDTVRHGTAPHGEFHHRSKLAETQVRQIRKRYATGETTLAKLAGRFGVSLSQVSRIVKYQSWKHLEEV